MYEGKLVFPQLRSPAAAYRRPLSPPLANRTVLQVDHAVCVYVLIAIVKKRLALEASLYTILQMVSVTMFEKMPLDQLLKISARTRNGYTEDNQLNLFED